MAQFRLPVNSRVKPGKRYPANKSAGNLRKFLIYRYDPTPADRPPWLPMKSTWTPAAPWCSMSSS